MRIGQLFRRRSGRPGATAVRRNFAPAPLLSSLGVSSSLFADASNFDQRFVEDYDKIETTVNALRTLGFKVVLTSGSFDIIHEGHSMYLEAARQFGDFLIVGLDSDEKIRARKGENRPVVPQVERLRMVTHQRGVGLVTLKNTQHPKWALIKAVRPDVLVATEETYTQEEIRELEANYCGRVEVLGRMATVSTSARLREVIQREMANPDSPVSTVHANPPRKRLTPAGRSRGESSLSFFLVKQILLYLPVVHAGHEAFFTRHRDAAEVLILGGGFKSVFKSLAKDIRALPPERAARFLQVMLPDTPIRVIQPADLPAAVTAETLVLPDEDITRNLAAEHHLGEGRELIVDKTFLRWDKEWSQARRPADFDGKLAVGDLPDRLVARARELAGRSSDWWRQVGAIAWRGEEILGAAWNHHYPTEYAPYIDGDPRDNFSRGVRADLSTAIHAEASVIAQAARAGRPLNGADLYVTTFPCPACARLIAESGFRRCYFTGPYAVLDGDKILQASGIELLWVDPDGPAPADQ
jgi:rfaE bifunctional protein nucleotidyltransferase chain/domain